MKTPLLNLALAATILSGCASASYVKKTPDGSFVEGRFSSLFSNSALRGVVIEGTTGKSSTGMRFSNGSSEPNAEAITATGGALGAFTGRAIKEAITPGLPK